jgi:hypothetical protein
VNNPKCEEVEIVEGDFINGEYTFGKYRIGKMYYSDEPQEESKQHLIDMKNHEDSLWEDEPKETLEEASKRLCLNTKERVGFYKCYSWQQERGYSEEDMIQFACECVTNFLSNNNNEIEMSLAEVIINRNNKQFEQFKKK